MEVKCQHLFMGVLLICIISYLLYNCINQNAELLEKIKDCNLDVSNVSDTQNASNKGGFNFSKLAKKGICEFGKSNNLEEIPKFLDV